jgi:homoserine O-acetyltransferase
VAVEAALADALGIERWAAVVGGSMGGMRALEWAVGYPDRLERSIVVACGAAASAEQIALCSVQNEAIRADPAFRGGDFYDAGPGAGPHRGMGIARRIGHISYRSEPELEARFGRAPQPGEDPLAARGPGGAPRRVGRYSVESYLDHHADKLARRFDAGSYIALSEAMNHHDVGRGRGGLAAALGRVKCKVWIAGIDSDRLYPLHLQYEMAALLPGQPEVTVVHSLYGHDSFLIEGEQVGAFLRKALEDGGVGEGIAASEERAG